jgi:hypothetical protein
MGLLVQAEALNDATGMMHGVMHEMTRAVMGDLSNVVEAGTEDRLAKVARVVGEARASNADTRVTLKATAQARIAATKLDMRIKATTEVVTKANNSRTTIVRVPVNSRNTRRVPILHRRQWPCRFRLKIRVRRRILPSRALAEASRIRK